MQRRHALTPDASGVLIFEVSVLEIVVVVLMTVRATSLVMSLALRLWTFLAGGTLTLERWRAFLVGCTPMNIAFNSATLPHQT